MPSRREGPPDPLGKRALFWVPGAASGQAGGAAALASNPEGKQALYSGAVLGADAGLADEENPVTERGPFVVTCQRCGGTSSVGIVDLLIFQLPLGVWWPRGRFDRRMKCPSCRTRAWCSVSLHRS